MVSAQQELAITPTPETEAFARIVEDLKKIHAIKSATYGDSWKKRGEVISIFGNVSRKFDRLEKIMSDPEMYMKALEGGLGEALEDTVMDLAVYSALWCTYISNTRTEAYQQALARALGEDNG